MKIFNIKDLSAKDKEKQNNAVNYFVHSTLPNKNFLQHFFPHEDIIFSDKALWEGFALVLTKRGLPNINDVKQDILIWWQDPNWPGFFIIKEFVIKNAQEFVTSIKNVILQAANEKDIFWFKNLLELLLETDLNLSVKSKDTITEMLDYLEDDSWKNFFESYFYRLKKILS